MERGRLAIDRRPGQTVCIGDVDVTVVRNNRGRLRLLVEAPRDMPIHRKEILERLRMDYPRPADAADFELEEYDDSDPPGGES